MYFTEAHVNPDITSQEKDPSVLATGLLGVANSLFPYHGHPAYPNDQWGRPIPECPDKDALTDKVLTAVLSTADFRIGAAPADTAQQKIRENIAFAVQRRIPLTLLGIWGTARFPNADCGNDAELADFAQIMSASSAVDRVNSVFRPGAEFIILEEDATCGWLDANVDSPEDLAQCMARMDQYYSTKKNMLRAFENVHGPSGITWRRETDVLQQMGVSLEEYYSGCKSNEPVFSGYLNACSKILDKMAHVDPDSSEKLTDKNYPAHLDALADFDQRVKQLPEFLELARIGWQGTIPPTMRDFYLRKYARIYPNENPDQHIQRLAHYFASTLEKAKRRTLYYGLDAQKSQTVVRMPLTLIPSGRPASFDAAVPLRSIPRLKQRGGPNTCVAAWLGESHYDPVDNRIEISQQTHDEQFTPASLSLCQPGIVRESEYPIRTAIFTGDR